MWNFDRKLRPKPFKTIAFTNLVVELLQTVVILIVNMSLNKRVLLRFSISYHHCCLGNLISKHNETYCYVILILYRILRFLKHSYEFVLLCFVLCSLINLTITVEQVIVYLLIGIFKKQQFSFSL